MSNSNSQVWKNTRPNCVYVGKINRDLESTAMSFRVGLYYPSKNSDAFLIKLQCNFSNRLVLEKRLRQTKKGLDFGVNPLTLLLVNNKLITPLSVDFKRASPIISKSLTDSLKIDSLRGELWASQVQEGFNELTPLALEACQLLKKQGDSYYKVWLDKMRKSLASMNPTYLLGT